MYLSELWKLGRSLCGEELLEDASSVIQNSLDNKSIYGSQVTQLKNFFCR
ncbi:hypothetical protein SAMN05421578_1354 [Paenibacillus macquariensis]|uniref:Uncharacterized protein n=1 Tax=Paenibacillus macquariensis TaxID=948756 RepID=A0ABY1KE46_9BACL|nr:hypothetical protein SAMN05421578_1354 [Paenibacillus macquariensis]